jgi:transcriptional regulator with GAF, ATPase, and Fis domain
MGQRLTAILGPLQGSTIDLTQPEVSIGREPSNTLSISDMLLSRKHCLIKNKGERSIITDLGSLNGIYVNKIRTTERLLEHGDQIQIGESLFLFLAPQDETLSDVEINKSGLSAQSTVQLRIEDAVYLKPKAGKALLPVERMAQDLSSLLKISQELNSLQDITSLPNKLIDLIFEIIPAERGAILLATEDTNEFTSTYAVDRRSGGTTVQVSDSIAHQVLHEKLGILCNGITHGEPSNKIHSLLCVPLTAFQKTLGIIYMDTSDPNVMFDEGHLQLLTGISGIAAVAFKNAGIINKLKDENRQLLAKVEHNIVGDSPIMQKIYHLISKIAPTDSNVLICGETGTGKELVARAIHRNSSRSDQPFIAINCAVLTETLLESELFGHEKGAFTGAIAQKKGKMELAEGGTLFLDEISEFSLPLQAKLLRVLQERELERVGGTRPIKVNFRLIAATNKILEECVKAGTFRQDLYFRLNVILITTPPLREHGDDIPLLASYFAAKCSKKLRRPFTEISKEALQYLTEYDWPGNVRELENTIERAMVLGCDKEILPEDLPDPLLELERPHGIPVITYQERLNETKKKLVKDAFEQAEGNHDEAAKLLGIHPKSLYRLIRNLKLRI